MINRWANCTIAMLAMALLVSPVSARTRPQWREAYQSSPAAYEPFSQEMVQQIREHYKVPPEVLEQLIGPPKPVTGTLRYRIPVSAAGSTLRIRLSNEEGTKPLTLSGASAGLAADGFDARAGMLKPLTFGGARNVTIPAGAPILSDPIDLAVEAGAELIVSIDTPDPLPFDPRGGSLVAVSSSGQALSLTLVDFRQIVARPLVTGISVLSSRAPRVIVALGDSITDGNRQKLGGLHGWPEELNRRLLARGTGQAFAVVNAGIGGNKLLASGWGTGGLARLDRDALRIEGISHLILLEGTNDIGTSGKSRFGANLIVSADDLIAGYRQVIARAHARGVKVVIGTLTPFGGSISHYSPEKESVRQAVNQWVRTSAEPDGVIDFDMVTRDPADPVRFREEFDSGDHLHPNDVGYKAMGDAIELSLFR